LSGPARTLALVAVLAGAALAAACAAPESAPPALGAAAGDRDADALLPVDCLLPPQQRKLGTQIRYLTAARPVKTSARDCEIRGGDYAEYDRASYATALKVWLAPAEEGDPEAQTYVGEIFEKGLGLPPDYTAARQWYERAAAQGHGPAQLNLGHLYEEGLGVEPDPVAALRWYRRAAGVEELDARFLAFQGSAEGYRELRSELGDARARVEALQAQVVDLSAELARSRAALREAQLEGEAERDRLAAVAAALAARREELDRRALAAGAAEAELAAERERLAAIGADPGALRAREQALRLEQEAVRQAQQTVARESEALAAERAALGASREALAARERDVARLEAELAASLAELSPAPEAELALAGPSLSVLSPDLIPTRSGGEREVVVSSRTLRLLGRVRSTAPLLSLLVNGVPLEADGEGYFESELRVKRTGTPVEVLAVDAAGQRASRRFRVRRAEPEGVAVAAAPPGAERATPVSLRTQPSGVEFGRYHALLIGNARYERMPPLRTAERDVRDVAALLEGRYGFEVTTVIDADRYALLSALDDLRARLGPADNLLIYYAGHGELDPATRNGYWLPVEAAPDDRAGWISTLTIADIVNAMRARHVLLVADSCYSGALTAMSLPTLPADGEAEDFSRWLELMLARRSRTALTSGDLAPVLDGGGGPNSVFARAFLDVLGRNREVLNGLRLFEEVSARVIRAARAQSFRQRPQYAPMGFSGHESGDFFFVPAVSLAAR